MAFSSSLCSSLSIANPSRTAISTRFSHKSPKLPLSLAFAILPISTTTAADVSGAIDGTTIVVVSEGFMAALAAMLSLTDPEQRRQLQVEVGDDDKEVVREYFNNSGFQRWKKIYGDTDEVNRVQRDIRLGHAKTVEKTLSMLKDEEGREVFELGHNVADELLVREGKVLEVLPSVVPGRDLAGEKVVAEMKVTEERHGSDGERNFQIHSLENRI
ncbi:Magnesium protoporphyrin IX methyltransferase, chloroplastic [Glycine soja]|uniref:Magnesium protoporphyrin IX methyltransferase, chloroplastic n=1 Tax=Glycine soja TaxID=3848 RepID=A0A445FJA1_GLYSO|nr:Magnesium protoporphyrin IX methyltransferase, chloroplastic [Glycine soja]